MYALDSTSSRRVYVVAKLEVMDSMLELMDAKLESVLDCNSVMKARIWS